MDKLITYSELLNAAIAAENAARTIYLAFLEKFLHNPDAAKFWQHMADDEKEHAEILSRIHGIVPVEDLTVLVGRELAEKAYQVQQWKVQEVIGLVKNLNDAYEIAYCIESSEVNTVFNFLAIRFLPSDESYSIISSTMDKHLLRLTQFSRTFGDADRCKKIHAAV